MFDLSTGPRRAVFFSVLAAGVVGALTIVDLLTGFPFAGLWGFDLAYLLCAIAVAVMGWEAWSELPPGPPDESTHQPDRRTPRSRRGRESATESEATSRPLRRTREVVKSSVG